MSDDQNRIDEANRLLGLTEGGDGEHDGLLVNAVHLLLQDARAGYDRLNPDARHALQQVLFSRAMELAGRLRKNHWATADEICLLLDAAGGKISSLGGVANKWRAGLESAWQRLMLIKEIREVAEVKGDPQRREYTLRFKARPGETTERFEERIDIFTSQLQEAGLVDESSKIKRRMTRNHAEITMLRPDHALECVLDLKLRNAARSGR